MLVNVENTLPVFAAIGRPVQTAIATITPQWAMGCHQDFVGVVRVDPDLANVARVFEPHVSPGFAIVRRLVNTIAVGDAALRFVFARTDPDGLGVVRIDFDSANGVGTFVVEDRRPGRAAIVGLPEIARCNTDQETCDRRPDKTRNRRYVRR